MNEKIIKQADDALTAREIFKGKVLDTADENVKEVVANLSKATSSDIVQIIGSKFVLYRKNDKNSKIVLPK